jgi:hypothetical protein
MLPDKLTALVRHRLRRLLLRWICWGGGPVGTLYGHHRNGASQAASMKLRSFWSLAPEPVVQIHSPPARLPADEKSRLWCKQCERTVNPPFGPRVTFLADQCGYGSSCRTAPCGGSTARDHFAAPSGGFGRLPRFGCDRKAGRRRTDVSSQELPGEKVMMLAEAGV